LVTLPDLSQLIPNQLQGLSPAHEDRKDWLWLSRLAFHSRRASASFNPSPLAGEVMEAAKQSNKGVRKSKILGAIWPWWYF
jgi:hypothetical protein